MSKNICSMCNGTGMSANYAKQVDPVTQKYGTFLGDSPQRDSFKRRTSAQQGAQCAQMCLPTPSCPPTQTENTSQSSTQIQIPCDPPTPCPKFVCEPCAPPPPTKIWLLKSTPTPQKVYSPSASPEANQLKDINMLVVPQFEKQHIISVGGSFDQGSCSSDGCKPLTLCFPCQISIQQPKEKRPEEELKPVGYISRNKDVDFVGGKFISGCTCGKKNGLTGNCPRISCQDNPGCYMNPPRCWPQFKAPEPPPQPPPQKMICVPFQLIYRDDRR